MEGLIFKLPYFEGPLDLLVYLVQQKKIDVKEISISELADEFMEYINKMKRLDMNLSSDFIATAAYLMELKSKALLPKPEAEEKAFEEEKQKFMDYIEKYAEIKETVRKIEKMKPKEILPIRISRTFGEFDKKLSKTIKTVLETIKIKEKVYKIKRESITVEEAINKIMACSFPLSINELLKTARTRYELVIILMAVLELIKMGRLIYSDGRLMKNG